MNGYRVTFYTQQGRSHNHMSIAEWLLREAKAIGVRARLLPPRRAASGATANTTARVFLTWASSPWK